MGDFSCKAIQVRQPSAIFYVASVYATDLETVCQPLKSPKKTGSSEQEVLGPQKLSEDELGELVKSLEASTFQKRSSEMLSEERSEPYQRFLDERRSLEIAKYLKEPNSLLPNSIILAVNVDLDEGEVLKRIDENLIEISLPRNNNSAVILDGQHRVDAFNYLPSSVKDGFQIVVTFLVGIPFYQQAELFAIINGKQKSVNKSIIYDLFGYAPIGGEIEERLYEGLLAVSRFCSHVTRILNNAKESPWKANIKMRGPGDEGVISQAAVVEYLTPLVQPKHDTKRLKTLPVLYSFYKDANPAACAALLIVYLSAIKVAKPIQWNDTKSLFWKNNGVAIIFRILHDEILLVGGAKQLMGDFQSIVTRWKKAPNQDLENPPPTGGGGLQNELYEKFQSVMFSDAERELIVKNRDERKETLVAIGGLLNKKS